MSQKQSKIEGDQRPIWTKRVRSALWSTSWFGTGAGFGFGVLSLALGSVPISTAPSADPTWLLDESDSAEEIRSDQGIESRAEAEAMPAELQVSKSGAPSFERGVKTLSAMKARFRENLPEPKKKLNQPHPVKRQAAPKKKDLRPSKRVAKSR